MSSSGQVIRAVQQFTKEGRSKQISFLKEVAIGVSLGVVAGFTWKVHPLIAPSFGYSCRVQRTNNA